MLEFERQGCLRLRTPSSEHSAQGLIRNYKTLPYAIRSRKPYQVSCSSLYETDTDEFVKPHRKDACSVRCAVGISTSSLSYHVCSCAPGTLQQWPIFVGD